MQSSRAAGTRGGEVDRGILRRAKQDVSQCLLSPNSHLNALQHTSSMMTYDQGTAREHATSNPVQHQHSRFAACTQALVGKATGAFKSIGLLAFMMWMSGSQLHIFSIMSAMSGVVQPLSAIMSSGIRAQTPGSWILYPLLACPLRVAPSVHMPVRWQTHSCHGINAQPAYRRGVRCPARLTRRQRRGL